MRVTVLLFAAYRERAGERRLELDLPPDATVGRLADEMARRYPGLASNPSRLVVAVNQEYRDHSCRLRDGDEVALIPPVSGGGVWYALEKSRLSLIPPVSGGGHD